ncbi:MAG TPA: SUMF1/EgtB/PvdO family nonheme iron enzyme [Labilithrix sp.]|nr:SUMF1/EgtB/PvdO family nonheme iron enzyme [Labilithrix sp.]
MSHRVLACLVCAFPLLGIASCGESETTIPDAAPINPNGKDPGAPCKANKECKSNRCEGGVCAAQTTSTGGKTCKAHTDCTTGCGDDGKCATAPSCTLAHGGRSCGPDGTDDCCAVATQGTSKIDKYLITAGRMRAFIERFDGNIKGFVDKLPTEKWNPGWTDDDALPTDVASANLVLGPAMKKACDQGPNTGHTYWTPKTDEDYSDFDQGTLDEKALNCVPWQLMQALCVWDGGHLATLAELKAAFTNGGNTKYPWGDDELANLNAPDPQERLNIEASYRTPQVPADVTRQNENGDPAEVSFLISPPGRYPKGNNQAGIADSAGNLLEWVGDAPRQFVWKADFEHHAANAAQFNGGYFWWDARKNMPFGLGAGPWIWGEGQLYGNAGNAGERNGYYSIGGRCAR